MSRQTDELLLYAGVTEENNTPAAPPVDVEKVRARLRSLMDLRKHPGYMMLTEAITNESRHCLVAMDRSVKGSQMIKHGANHYSLTMVLNWLESEIIKLSSQLER